MRESYRDKQNRKSRIARERLENYEKKRKNKIKKIENKQYQNKDDEKNNYEDIIAGRNAVLELLKSGKDINKLFIEKGEKHGSINEIIAKAKENKIVIVEVDKLKLDNMAENHQGVIAIVPPFNYCDRRYFKFSKRKKRRSIYTNFGWNRRSP